MSYKYLCFSIVLLLTTVVCFADDTPPMQDGVVTPPSGYNERTNKPFKRIIENGGEVIIDGSLRVLEPIYGKDFDLIETTVPVTPTTNHVRLYAVQTGTFTTIKALFDDGTTKVITAN